MEAPFTSHLLPATNAKKHTHTVYSPVNPAETALGQVPGAEETPRKHKNK